MHTQPDKALQERIAAMLEKNPSSMVRNMARELETTELVVTAALPESLRLHIPAAEFEYIWLAMAEWEKTLFMAESPGAVLEVSGRLPKGKMAHGMYNLMDKNYPLGGHLLVGELDSIWLVSKPSFGLESHSVQFFTNEGRAAFAVYLGRGAKKEIIPSVREGYMNLWAQYKNGELN